MFEPPPPTVESARTFEWSSTDRPSDALVQALAAETGRDPTDLPPLYDAIDLEALDSLFVPSAHADAMDAGTVTLEYLDYRIRIESTGRGYIYEAT